MSKTYKTVPENWKNIVNAETISRSISRISYEIVEKNRDIDNLAIVGIRTGGEALAKRIHTKISEIEKREIYLQFLKCLNFWVKKRKKREGQHL